MNKIPVGVSSCLIGEKVRWNGDHKQDRYLKDVLFEYFEWVPVCPEIEVGMGVPRETVALYGEPENPQMLSKKTKTDWTEKMNSYSIKRIKQKDFNALCGFIFKSKSPSCGISRIAVHERPGAQSSKQGQGLFAKAFINKFPLVPTEEEGRLNDFKIRENFIVRVFSFYRLQQLFSKTKKRGALVKFHEENKFLLLAHSRNHYRELGRIVANIKEFEWNDARDLYCQKFMEALTFKSTSKKNSDVLMHMLGFFKKLLNSDQKKDILEAIDDYRNGLTPLIVPLVLIRHHVRIHKIDYLTDQVYLNPHPKELMLRNHV